MEFPNVVELNVGGRHFTTSLATLTKYPDSMLAAMFSGRHHVSKDKDGRYFLDLDGDDFVHILKFLRFHKLPPVEKAVDILECAEYLCLMELKSAVSDCLPVKAISLYDKVRQQTPDYPNMLQTIKNNLSSSYIHSSSVLIVMKGSCAYDCLRAGTPLGVTQTFNFDNYWKIEVQMGSPSTGVDLSAIATALVHDLKAFGTYPEDGFVYKPDKRCYCTVGVKIKLIV